MIRQHALAHAHTARALLKTRCLSTGTPFTSGLESMSGVLLWLCRIRISRSDLLRAAEAWHFGRTVYWNNKHVTFAIAEKHSSICISVYHEHEYPHYFERDYPKNNQNLVKKEKPEQVWP